MIATSPSTATHRSHAASRLTTRQETVAVVLLGWLVLGGFVDGWAHYNGRADTSFFTPWHAVLYSGYLAATLWLQWQIRRRQARGARGRHAIPTGYGLGLVGSGVFAAGGVLDLAWHQVFGVEVGIEALLSPTHLMLFVGTALMTTSPLRSALSNAELTSPGFRELLPALLSTAYVTALVAFFLKHHSPFFTPVAVPAPYRAATSIGDARIAAWVAEEVRLVGVAAVLMMTLILVAPMLLLVRRWRLPRGNVTLLFGTVATLMAAMRSYSLLPTVVAALIAGGLADVLVIKLRPHRSRPLAVWVIAGVVPITMWSTYFLIIALGPGMAWSAELWAGSIAMAAIAAVGLAVLMVPSGQAAKAEDLCGATWH